MHPLRDLRRSSFQRESGETTLLIAKGSAAIAAAASVIAAGAFLVDGRRREWVIKGAREVYKRTKKLRQRLPDELPDAYYAVSHQVGRKGALRKASKILKKKSPKRH